MQAKFKDTAAKEGPDTCTATRLYFLEVVKAHVAVSPKVPRTIHYRGDGQFMVAGREVSLKRMFKPQNL